MKPRPSNPILIALALLALSTLSSPLSTVFAQGTAFTYQGRLADDGNPAQGIYDLRFTIHDSATNGNVVAGPLTNAAVAFSNGLATVGLDFGSGVFTGDARWLEIGVRTNGGSDFNTLAPRQPLTPAPCALYAPSAGTAGSASNLLGVLASGLLSGTYSNMLNLSNPANSFGGDGSQLTAIGTSALADNSVTSAKIVDGTITSADISDGQIATVDLAASAVTTARLADNSVTSAKIVDGTVGTADIVDSAISTVKLADNAVTSAKIVDGAITSADMGDGQVATLDLAANAVTTAKLADSSVTSAKIVDATVSTADIADSAITTVKLADNSVTSAKIVDGTITSTDISDGQLGTVDLANSAVNTAKLADNSVTTAKIVDGTIASGDLADNSVGSSKLANDAGSLAKVTDLTMVVWGGNIGIGTSIPAEQLTVNGNAYVTGYLGINTDPATAALDVAGDLRVRNLIRSGMETRTSEAPSPAGLVVRRINSLNNSANQVVAVARNSANTANVTLERDGSAGGFLIRYPANPGRITVACMGIDDTGAQKNFYRALNNPAAAGTVQIYTDAGNCVHFECTFGDTYDTGEHLTQVFLSRYAGDTYWSGAVVSTYNQ